MREFEAESGKLKKLLTESLLDAKALKAALGEKRLPHRPSARWWR